MSENASEARTPDQMPEGDADRQHGQEILDMLHTRNSQGADPFLELLNRAYQAEAEADNE